MQNTVTTVEHNALNLSSNAYMNSTTKFVKGIQPVPPTTSIQTIIPASLSSIAVGKQQNAQSSIHLSSLIFKPAPQGITTGEGNKKSSKKSPSKNEGNSHMSDVQITAINLSANIFMNATTKFMKGYADLSPVKKANSRSPKQKKSLSQGKKVDKSPKKTIDPQAKPSPSSIKKQRTPQKNALDMTASNYMSSTTKYVKPSPQVSTIDPAKGKIQKIVRSNNKLGRILSRDKGGNQKSNGKELNGEKSIDHSKSSSENKLSRRKDRTKQIKFIEKKQPEESLETVKDRPKSIDFNTKRNDTKIQPQKVTPKPQISQLIMNSIHHNPNQDSKQISITPSISNLDPKPPLNRLARNTINVVKSADTKRSDVKEQNSKPFSRQPQNARPQLIQKTHQIAKTVLSLPSGQLPLQTPMKLKVESSKLITTKEESHINKPIQRANYKQTAQISVIKEEKSSALQNTKTSIHTKRSINQGSTKEEPSSTHIYENHTQIVGSKNNDNSKASIAKDTNSKVTTKEEPSEVMHASYGLAKVNSTSNIKSQLKVVDAISYQAKRQLATKQDKTESAKEIQVQTRKTTTPSILQEKKLPIQRSQKQIQSKMTAKTQTQDRGSKTSIDEPTIDSTKSKPTVISQNNQINITSQSKLQQIKPQQSPSSNNIKANDIAKPINITIAQNSQLNITSQNKLQQVKPQEPSSSNDKPIIKPIPTGVGHSSQINIPSQNRLQQIKPQESPRNNNIKVNDNDKQIIKPISPRQSIKSSNIKPNDNDKFIVKPIPTVVVQNNQTSQNRLQQIKPQEPSSNNIKINENNKQIVKPISLRQSIKLSNEIKKQQQKEKPKEERAKKLSNLKRSEAIVQVCLKFYTKLLKEAFYSIINLSIIAKKHSKQAQIVAYCTLSTYKNIQKQFKLTSFEKIKRIAFSKILIKGQINQNLNKEIASTIIFRTLISKEREYFNELNKITTFNAPHHKTQNLSKKQSIKQAKDSKIYPLQQLIKIIKNFIQNKLHQSFNKLTLFASQNKKLTQKQPSIQQARNPPKQTKPSRDYQAQKLALIQTKSELQTTISSMQSRITDKKRYSDIQKSRLLKKQDDLAKKNKTIDVELIQKRKKNKELKNQVEQLSQQGQDLDISLPEYEPLIGILTEIYSTIFASKDQTIKIESLIKKYQLNKQDHNPLLDQWESLIQNATLKSQISKWQGNDPFNRPNQKVINEFDIICKLTRSYIRERYLWQWVKISAQKV